MRETISSVIDYETDETKMEMKEAINFLFYLKHFLKYFDNFSVQKL